MDGESDDSDEVDDAGEPYRDIGAEVALVAIGISSEVEVRRCEDEDAMFELSISFSYLYFIDVSYLDARDLGRLERDLRDGTVSLHTDWSLWSLPCAFQTVFPSVLLQI